MVALTLFGPIYSGDGSSVEKDHPSSINMGRTMRRTIGVSIDSSHVYTVFIVIENSHLLLVTKV